MLGGRFKFIAGEDFAVGEAVGELAVDSRLALPGAPNVSARPSPSIWAEKLLVDAKGLPCFSFEFNLSMVDDEFDDQANKFPPVVGLVSEPPSAPKLIPLQSGNSVFGKPVLGEAAAPGLANRLLANSVRLNAGLSSCMWSVGANPRSHSSVPEFCFDGVPKVSASQVSAGSSHSGSGSSAGSKSA